MHGEQIKPNGSEDPWELALLSDRSIARVDTPGSWFQYRPGRLVVDRGLLAAETDAAKQVRALLERAKAEPQEGPAAHVAEQLGLALFQVPEDGVDLPRLAAELREIAPSSAGLDHVLVADPHRMGGTTPAEPAPRPTDIPGPDSGVGKGLTIAILDSGLDKALNLAPVPPGAEEVLDSDHDGDLDLPAGHGTFITGIVRRYAPGANIVVARVLTGLAGIASELEVAEAILALPPVDLINCSFGGPSQGDGAPLVIERALASLSPGTVVVAAAGNQSDSRPHFPGASKRVFAIASVDGGKGHEGWDRAEYSNFGPWVDAAAPGTRVHSTFVEFKEHGPLPNRVFEYGAHWSGTSFATPGVVGAIAALASRDGIPVREAAYRLIEDPSRLRIPDIGTLVVPTHLPPSP